jgi:hypothetical protein
MSLKLIEFCPPIDAETLLQFRGDAYQAMQRAPLNQKHWVEEYALIGKLLEQAGAGPLRLDVR